MYSAVIRAGKVEIREGRKKKSTIAGSESGVEAIAVDRDGDQVKIHWNDGSSSEHSLPGGDVIRRQ
jgi:hypothetical protein